MLVLFRIASFIAAAATVIGYGSVLLALSVGPLLPRMDAADAAAVSSALHRAGTRRNERAALLVGPALLAVAATSQGRVPWSAWWLWAVLAGWALSTVVNGSLVQPARRAALVLLGELAGTGSAPAAGGADAKRAQVNALLRRAQFGTLVNGLIVAASLACVAVGATT